jgi:galactokinase
VQAYAPGRVNLIGDHTDYTGGWVCPMAIDLGTTVSISPGGTTLSLRSDFSDTPAAVPIDVVDLGNVTPAWAKYVAGVLAVVRPRIGGEGRVSTTLPVGAGLSSSAALEVALALALGFEDDDVVALATACQQAEVIASGVPCGIMDQLISAGGVAGHAVVIDCATLERRPVPIPDDVEVVVVHSGEERALAGSAYAQRRAEVEAGVSRRVRHVASENARVSAFADALSSGDLEWAGALMIESHVSLRDDFEVSTPGLDGLVSALLTAPGVYGARLTGAGFGGCVVALAAPGTAARLDFERMWVVRPSAGARLLDG